MTQLNWIYSMYKTWLYPGFVHFCTNAFANIHMNILGNKRLVNQTNILKMRDFEQNSVSV